MCDGPSRNALWGGTLHWWQPDTKYSMRRGPAAAPRVTGLQARTTSAVIGLLSVSTRRLWRFDTTVAYTRPSRPPDHTVPKASSATSAHTLRG